MDLRLFITPFLLAIIGSLTSEAGTGHLQVRVVDSNTRKAIASRLSVKAADGTFPGDRIGLSRERWPNIEAHGIFISGEASLDLPSGKTLVKASAGPQYKVASSEIEVVEGKTIEIEFSLERLVDLRKAGWVSGDAHLHMIHGEMQRQTSYAEIATTCRACGLDWAYVNQEYGGAGENSLEDFHADCRKVSTSEFQLLLGAERPKSLLGHNALIGVQNPFVVPDDPPYHLAAQAIHEQGGVLFPVHPVRYFPEKRYQGEWLDFPGNNLARELVFDAYLGPSFDGLSVLSDEPNSHKAHELWFNLLNKGFFVPAFADSDACFDRPTLQKSVPGFWATYLEIGSEAAVNNATLAAAVRRGRTMATTGPLILWNVDGQPSGSTIPNDGQPHQVAIEVIHDHHNWTLEDSRVAKVELIRNGKIVRVWEPNMPQATLSHVVNEHQRAWYAARAFGADPKWQVAVASPIYFAEEPKPSKQDPLAVDVRGRVYDFRTGERRRANISVMRHGTTIQTLEVDGSFTVRMPLDATISATDQRNEMVEHDLLLGYAPVHHLLWKLDSEALSKTETLDKFESIVNQVDLEFPLGYRMSGCYAARELSDDVSFEAVEVVESPQASSAPAAVTTILLDKRRVKPGDTVNIAVLFHKAADVSDAVDHLLVVEGRAYDPRRPTGFNPLKVFDTFEAKWSQANDAGRGYRAVLGKLTIPEWIEGGPVNAVEINAIARGQRGQFESHVGLRIPLGETSRALMVASNWPDVPISWHDHNYGIGPLRICGKLGRQEQPQVDYRELRLAVRTSAGRIDLSPSTDCQGCADAADAIFTDHFLDQILNDESKLRD